MKAFARRVVAGLAVIAAFLGMSVVTASPAAAATGAWLNYRNTNPITVSESIWRCGTTEEIASDVVAQVCAIRSPSGASKQGAVIVRNNRSTTFVSTADVQLWDTAQDLVGDWNCAQANLTAHSWVVCFGKTLATRAVVQAGGTAYYSGLSNSPYI